MVRFFIIDQARVVLEVLVRVQWQIATDKELFIERQLKYLTLCIEGIVNDNGATEISKLLER